MSITAKLVILGALMLAVLAGAWKLWHSIDQRGYQRAQAEHQARAELQRETNRGNSRQAEEREAARTITITRYITRATKEVRNATQSLDACPIAPEPRRMLNDAARCTDENRPASCSAGDSLPAPG